VFGRARSEMPKWMSTYLHLRKVATEKSHGRDPMNFFKSAHLTYLRLKASEYRQLEVHAVQYEYI
jgi:alpha-ketoglutarate-dependent taurine dioxygenase